MIDWLTNWLINQFNNWSIDWLNDLSNDWLVDQLINWSIGWFINKLIDQWLGGGRSPLIWMESSFVSAKSPKSSTGLVSLRCTTEDDISKQFDFAHFRPCWLLSFCFLSFLCNLNSLFQTVVLPVIQCDAIRGEQLLRGQL